MPRRNAIRYYGAEQYYHCYNRGVNKTNLFGDDDDYGYFLSLFARHLSNEPKQDKTRRQYPHYFNHITPYFLNKDSSFFRLLLF